MALTKPILYNINAFDATKEQIFTFEAIGGDQVVANELTVVDQATGTTVYQKKQYTNAFKHTLPANALSNNKYYFADIRTYNNAGDASSKSTAIQFRCYLTPVWKFTNVPEDGIIDNATYVFKLVYDQEQYEYLSSCTIYLYDENKKVISSESYFIGYPPLSPPYYEINYEVTGLDNATVYYIRATGETRHKINIDTGFIQIKTLYTIPDTYGTINLSQNCDKGSVIVKSEALAIKGHSIPDKLQYVENNTAVLMDTTNGYITWDENLSIQGNYKAILWGRNFAPIYPNPTPNAFALTIEDDDESKIAVYLENIDEQETQYRLKGIISVFNESRPTIFSNTVTLKNVNLLQQIIITKTNIGEYSLEYKVLQEYSDTAVLGEAIIGVMVLGKGD